MTLYLQMDGINDFLKTPSILFDEIIIDFKPRYKASGWSYIVDARSGASSGYFAYNSGNITSGANWGSYYTNNVISVKPPLNVRSTLRLLTSSSTNFTDDIAFCSISSGLSDFLECDMYNIKILSDGIIVAHYDMTTGTVQDQSGNGRHATLTGGTFVDDGAGSGTAYSVTLNDSITLSDSISKKITGYKTFSDSINLFDSISYQLTSPGQYTTTLLDSITLSDILTIKLGGTIMGVPNIKKMVEGVMPGTTATTLYTAPANTTGQPSPYATSIIKDIWLVNTSGTARTITLGINGVAVANQIIPAQTVPANTTLPVSGLNKLLKAGDTIQALQENATAITVHIDGVEVQ